MSLLFYPRKSHRHLALRELALAKVVYDHQRYLIAKVQNILEYKHTKAQKLHISSQISEKKTIKTP